MTTTAAALAALLSATAAAAARPAAPPPPWGLVARGPAPGLEDKLALFGQLVGDWEFDVVWYPDRAEPRRGTGEWSFHWVLDGTAIQDVWRTPTRAASASAGEPGRPAAPVGFGTGIKYYDAARDRWWMTWTGVTRQQAIEFVGRQVGDEIVLDAQGVPTPVRWIYSEITRDSFRWRNESSPDGGKSWRVDQEMRVRRRLE